MVELKALYTLPAVVICALLFDLVETVQPFDPYKVLGVTKSASQPEIKKVYKRLAKEW